MQNKTCFLNSTDVFRMIHRVWVSAVYKAEISAASWKTNWRIELTSSWMMLLPHSWPWKLLLGLILVWRQRGCQPITCFPLLRLLLTGCITFPKTINQSAVIRWRLCSFSCLRAFRNKLLVTVALCTTNV